MKIITTLHKQRKLKNMSAKMQSGYFSKLLALLLVGSFLLTACAPGGAAAVQPDPAASAASPEISAPQETAALLPSEAPAAAAAPNFSLDTGSIATGFQTETVAALSPGEEAPYWEVLPEYIRITLQGYPIRDHLMQPQIFIYPVAELGAVNEGAGKIAASLETLLQSPREITPMPFLPLFNAAQVLHTHLQYLDFKDGQGLRYLAHFSQGIVPVNNFELIYTYQGLTSDGKYYVAAVLPVNHSGLPADGSVTGDEPPEFTSDFPAYLQNVANTLNTQSADTFTPDLTQLDAMLSSLEIN